MSYMREVIKMTTKSAAKLDCHASSIRHPIKLSPIIRTQGKDSYCDLHSPKYLTLCPLATLIAVCSHDHQRREWVQGQGYRVKYSDYDLH